MKNDVIAALETKGFNRWTKGTMDRLYINPTRIGLELYYYNTGNVSSAYLNGERISNTCGREMKAAKCYIDIATGECVSDYDVFVEAMQQLLAEAEAETAEEESSCESEALVDNSAVVVSSESIDEVLPTIDYFAENYFFKGYAGDITEKSCLRRVVIRIEDDGSVTESDYGYGMAMPICDYKLDGLCIDVADYVCDWMRGILDRTDVICSAVSAFAALNR